MKYRVTCLSTCEFFRSYQPDESVLKALEVVLFWKLEKILTKVLLKKQQHTKNSKAKKQQEQQLRKHDKIFISDSVIFAFERCL